MVATGAGMSAALVEAGWGTPAVCARHGQPATRFKRVSFRARQAWWGVVLVTFGVLLFGLIPALVAQIVALLLIGLTIALIPRVESPSWPFCPSCDRRQRARLTGGISVLVAGILLYSMPFNEWQLPLALGVFAVAAVLITQGTSGSVAAGRVSRDRTTVEFRRARAEFVRQADATEEAAARQYLAQS